MKAQRVWVEIVILATTIAFALALLIATLGAAAAAVGELRPRQATRSDAERTFPKITPSGSGPSLHSSLEVIE